MFSLLGAGPPLRQRRFGAVGAANGERLAVLGEQEENKYRHEENNDLQAPNTAPAMKRVDGASHVRTNPVLCSDQLDACSLTIPYAGGELCLS